MTEIAGHPIEKFTPHDFRRTARSNTKRLKVDFETAEATMNHLRSGMERIYSYELVEEKAAWFLKWEEIAAIARRVVALAACNSHNSSTAANGDNAGDPNAANLTATEQNPALGNGPGGADMNTATNSAMENAEATDLNTNDRDTNLANGM